MCFLKKDEFVLKDLLGELWNIRSLGTLMRHLFFKKGLKYEELEHYPPMILNDGDELYF